MASVVLKCVYVVCLNHINGKCSFYSKVVRCKARAVHVVCVSSFVKDFYTLSKF
ncbi:unnamed protein product [Arabidopsis halleri]